MHSKTPTYEHRARNASVNHVADAALAYAAVGWHVFPCHTPNLPGCSCLDRETCANVGKHPRTRNGLKDATIDPSQIRTWWRMWPEANVGMATGVLSRLVVLDEDSYRGGDGSRRDLEQSYQPLPETVIQLTGGGGVQYLFTHPGTRVPNSVDKLGPGLDIRADGGYIITPPSLHKSGKQYAWDTGHHPDDIPPAAMPDWLLALCLETTQREAPSAGDVIPQGRRNYTLFQLGCSFRAKGCTGAVILAALQAMNATQCHPPLRDEEVATIAASCAKYEPGSYGQPHGPVRAPLAHPRTLPRALRRTL